MSIHKSFISSHEMEMPLTEATWIQKIPQILRTPDTQSQDIYVSYLASKLDGTCNSWMADGPFIAPKHVNFGFAFVQPMKAIFDGSEQNCEPGDLLVTTQPVEMLGFVRPGIAYYICIGMAITDEPESGEEIGECPVCYNIMYKFRTTMCINRHQLCVKCSTKWSKMGHASCPLCRDGSVYKSQ